MRVRDILPQHEGRVITWVLVDMKPLAVSGLALALTLCLSDIMAAPSSAGSAVSQGPRGESAESSLTLFYKPGRTKTQIDVSVDESAVTRIQPGETIKLLPPPAH